MRTLHIGKTFFALVALAAVVSAFVLLGGLSNRTAEAQFVGTVGFVGVDMDTTGNLANALSAQNSCGQVTGTFDVDVTVNAYPAEALANDKLASLSFRIRYDNTKLSFNSFDLSGGMLAFAAGSSLIANPLPADDGDISVGALDVTTNTEDNIAGIGARVNFSVVGTGFSEITIIGDSNQTQVVQVDNGLYDITNLAPYQATPTFGEAQSFAAISPNTCGANTDSSVAAGAATVTDPPNGSATGFLGNNNGILEVGEQLTLTYVATVDSSVAEDIDLASAGVQVQFLADPFDPGNDCVIGAASFSAGPSFPGLSSPTPSTVTHNVTCFAPANHQVDVTADVSFSNPTATESNAGDESDGSTALFQVEQEVDVAEANFTATAAPSAAFGCTTATIGGGGTVTFGATSLQDTGQSFAGFAGQSVAILPAAAAPQTRLIVAVVTTTNADDTLVIAPAWNPTPPDFTTGFAVAQSTNLANTGDKLCANLGLPELSLSQNISDLPSVQTGVSDSVEFTVDVDDQTAGGASPAVTVANTVSLILPDLCPDGVDIDGPGPFPVCPNLVTESALDFALGGLPVEGICGVTQPTTATVVTSVPPDDIGIAYTGGAVECTESSFLDTDLNGSPNLRLQTVVLVATTDIDPGTAGIQFPNPSVSDTDEVDNTAFVSNLTLTGPTFVFAFWSTPDWLPSPINGGPAGGDIAYQSLIDDFAGNFLEKSGVGLEDPFLELANPGSLGVDPNDDDVCLVAPSTCSLGSYQAQGDQYSGAQDVELDGDLDGVFGGSPEGTNGEFADQGTNPDRYIPLAGSIIFTPGEAANPIGAGPQDAFFVQPSINLAALGDARLLGMPNSTVIGFFNATLRVDIAGSPKCTTTVGADLPPANLLDAAMPSAQPWVASAPLAGALAGGAAAEGTADFAPQTLTVRAGSTISTINIVEDLTNLGGVTNDISGFFFTPLDQGTTPVEIGKSRTIASNTIGVGTSSITLDAPIGGVLTTGQNIRVSAITSPDFFPTNLLTDAQVVPFVDLGAPMWYRYVGVALTSPPTPVNSVAFNLGANGYASVTVTGDPNAGVPVTPTTTVQCTPLISESVILDSAAGIDLRTCATAGNKTFAVKFVRADTGGEFTIADISTCTEESDVTVAGGIVLDPLVVVATDLSASEEAVPANPDADATNDREVEITVTNGLGPIPVSGVDVEGIAVSGLIQNNPIDPADDVTCETRWNFDGTIVTLVQRLTVGDINLDRVTYNTGALGINVSVDDTDVRTLDYNVDCSGNSTNVGAGLPAVTVLISTAVGGPPDPNSANNSESASTTVTLDGNVDGDAFINSLDNCPFTFNDNQRNADANDPLGNDLTGNACDADDDNDLVLDTDPDSCTPGIPGGTDRPALSAATLLTFQEDPDGQADTDGCRDVDLSVVYSGTTGNVDLDTPTAIGPITATVSNLDTFISASGVLTTQIISRALLPGEGSNPTADDAGCQVDIGGAGFTQDADIDSDGDLDHQSIRTDLISLGSGGVVNFVFDVTVTCPDTGVNNMTIDGSTSTLAPIADSNGGNDTDTHLVTANAFGTADLSVAKGIISAPSLYVPVSGGPVAGAPVDITMPTTVRNNGPDNLAGTFAVLSASGSDEADCTGDLSPASISPSSGPYDLNAATQTTNTETFTVSCTAAAGSSVTFTFTDSVALGGGSFLNDPNGANDSSVKSVTLLKDTDADNIADGADNCPNDANPSQTDSDGDGIGNACDSTATHDVAASNLVSPSSTNVIRNGPTASFLVTATATNNSTHAEDVTLALDIDQSFIPSNCTASATLLSPASPNQNIAGGGGSVNVTYNVDVTCTGSGFEIGSIEVTFSVTHVSGGTGVETNLIDNNQSATVSVTAF